MGGQSTDGGTRPEQVDDVSFGVLWVGMQHGMSQGSKVRQRGKAMFECSCNEKERNVLRHGDVKQRHTS
jgi:hypothetical protein